MYSYIGGVILALEGILFSWRVQTDLAYWMEATWPIYALFVQLDSADGVPKGLSQHTRISFLVVRQIRVPTSRKILLQIGTSRKLDLKI